MKIEGTKILTQQRLYLLGAALQAAGATGSGVEAEVQLGNHNISYFLEKKVQLLQIIIKF